MPRTDRADRLLLGLVRTEIAVPDNLVAIAGLTGSSRRTAHSWKSAALADRLLVVENGLLRPGPAWGAWWKGRAWDRLPATLVRVRDLTVAVKAACATVWSEAQEERRIKNPKSKWLGCVAIQTDLDLANRAMASRHAVRRARRVLVDHGLGEAAQVQRGRARLAVLNAAEAPWTLFPGAVAGADRAARAARGRLRRGVQSTRTVGVQSARTPCQRPYGYTPDHRPALPAEMVTGSSALREDGLEVPEYVQDGEVIELDDVVDDVSRDRSGRVTRSQREAQERERRENAAALTRQFLADRGRVVRVIQRGTRSPLTVVEELLGLVGFFDKQHQMRRKWAHRIVSQHTGTAAARLVVVIGDVARDRGVVSIGATLRRRIPDLCSNRPELAISAHGPQSVAEVLELFGQRAAFPHRARAREDHPKRRIARARARGAVAG